MASLILALDQGTTSSRALLFDAGGRVVATAQAEFPQHYPRPGWVEHDPDDLWRSQLAVAQEVLARAGVRPADVAAVGLTNQRETTLLWDRRTGEPVANAVVWQDRRTEAMCARWRAEGWEEDVRARTGLRLDPYFSASKVVWLLEHTPGLRARAERGEVAFGTVDTWLLWRLTGGRVHATDVTNASRTLLFNIHQGRWDPDLLARFGVPESLLPEVCPSGGYVYGETDPALLGEALPLAGVAGDQQAATFGQVCCAPGAAKNTYGTGCFLLLNTGERAAASRHGLLTTPAWQLAGQPITYALEGSVFVAGAAVQWLRDALGLIASAAETEALAQSVPDTAGVQFVPAFVDLGAPYWDGEARGALLGLTRGAGRAHIVRAVLESVCFSTRAVVDAMQADAGLSLPELRVDGGMTANGFLMQTQADLLGVPVVRPAVAETTARGAAFLAGLTVGVWDGVGALAGLADGDTRWEPHIGPEERDARYAGWQAAVARVRTGE